MTLAYVRFPAGLFTMLALMVLLAGPLVAADRPPNVPLPTTGGKQFWTDELFFRQWRIQRNVFTGHFRLLDEKDRRQAWGTLEQCRDRLEEIKRTRRLPPMRGKAVIVLHGLVRSHDSMNGLCKHLRERGHFEVFNVTYASTQGEIGDYAAALGRIVQRLEGIEEISFVGHSLGNIVIRYYLAGEGRQQAEGKQPATQVKEKATPGRPDPRIKRFVMLAPPNHGSLAALVLAETQLFKGVAGGAGQQLGRDWDKLEGKLATPAFEFGVLAGGKSDGQGFTRLLPGDDDGTISVDTTRLAGACDFAVLPVRHTFIMDDPRVQEYTLRFLQKGCFVSAGKRQPIDP
jgi:pimeloyl-ACP methyl ester carboxylesterase